MLAQASAATAAASSTTALPVSVARKSRSGACRLRAQAVRPLNLDWGPRVAHPGSFSSPVTLVAMRRMLQLVLLSVALAICGAVPAQAALTPTITSFPSSDPPSDLSGPSLDHGRERRRAVVCPIRRKRDRADHGRRADHPSGAAPTVTPVRRSPPEATARSGS